MSETRKGLLAGIVCYVFWGLCPLYWKLLTSVNSFEIIAHRIIWCTVFVVVACLVLRKSLREMFRSGRAWRILGPAAVLIAFNWGLYIYAVNAGHVVETAIGYYINPLVSILLGVLLFKERLTRIQIAAVALCVVGVGFFTLNYGQFPWIAICLACSFGLYGALKKKGGYEPVQALAMENLILIVPAFVFAAALAFVTGSHGFLGDVATPEGWGITALLVGAGAVSAFPLLLFSSAANKIPLSMLGFIQYLSPTIALLLGVFLFGEAFTFAHGVMFGCVWAALALVSAETIRNSRS